MNKSVLNIAFQVWPRLYLLIFTFSSVFLYENTTDSFYKVWSNTYQMTDLILIPTDAENCMNKRNKESSFDFMRGSNL